MTDNYILDLSYHNNDVDMEKIAKSGIYGVILRAGYGYNTIDKKFKQNMENAIKNGLHIGVYWFGYAKNDNDAKKEAQFFLSILNKYKGKIDLPIFYDWEYDSYNYIKENFGIKATKELVSSMTTTFCTELEKNGWYSGFYANVDYLKNFYTEYTKKRFCVWVAQWSTILTYSGNYVIWQYTDNARNVGVTGKVDKNVTYIDLPKIIKNAKLNGFGRENEKTEFEKFDLNCDGKVDEKDLKILENYLKEKGVI